MPLIIEQVSTPAVGAVYDTDPEMAVWWATVAECTSALGRLERDGTLSGEQIRQGIVRLDALAAAWSEVSPGDRVRRLAIRHLRVHRLRAADAFQLAAASIAADDRPATLPLVTLDERLAAAAEREGFAVVLPGPVPSDPSPDATRPGRRGRERSGGSGSA